MTTDIVHEVGIKDQNGGIKHLSGNGIGRDHGKKKTYIHSPCMNHRCGSQSRDRTSRWRDQESQPICSMVLECVPAKLGHLAVVDAVKCSILGAHG